MACALASCCANAKPAAIELYCMAPRPRTTAVAAATTQTTSLGAPNCFTASTSFSRATHGPPTQLFSSDYHTPNVHSRRLLELLLFFVKAKYHAC